MTTETKSDAATGSAASVDKERVPGLAPWARVGWALFAVALLAGGCAFYRFQERTVRRHVEERLSTIVQLKSDWIADWRRDEWEDAALLADNPFLVEGLPQLWSDPDAKITPALEAFFRQVRTNHGYADIVVVDGDGRIRFSLTGRDTLPKAFSDAVTVALHERKRVFVDLIKPDGAANPQCAMVAPFCNSEYGSDAPARGALVLVNDATQYLYPIIQKWPTESATAETFLVRREGDEVLVLNELRHRAGAAFNVRYPMSDTEKPMVQAVLGQTGVIETRDYRGVAVLAGIGPIPDSPWFIVSKIDMDEAFADWHARSVLIMILLASGIAAVATWTLLYWYRLQRSHYRTLYGAEAQRRLAAERFGIILTSIGDGVIVTDCWGNIELFNGPAEEMTGWSQAEAQGKPLVDIFHIVNEFTRAEVENPVTRVLREGSVVGWPITPC